MTEHDLPRLALSRGTAPFPELAARYFEEYLSKIEIAVGLLPEENLWWRPVSGANSAGNLLLHLAGNLSLWVLHHLGAEPFERNRAAELSACDGGTREELLVALTVVVERAAAVARALRADRLSEPVEIQGYRVDRLGALFHAVEHMSYHTGQLLWLVKARGEAEIELYPQHAGE